MPDTNILPNTLNLISLEINQVASGRLTHTSIATTILAARHMVSSSFSVAGG